MPARRNADDFRLEGATLCCPEDMTSVPPKRLEEWCDRLLEARGEKLRVDLTATRYLQSHHLGILADAWTQALGSGRGMELIISPRLRRIFEASGFDRVFELVEREDEDE